MTFTLIGMPGAGKTCMGRAIAHKLHMALIDTDRLIESRVGMKLQQIINERGLAEFKKIEEQTLLSIHADRTILTTGGSAVYYDRAMEHLKTLGPIIYLYTSLDTVIKRIGDFSTRGIALLPGQTIKDLYEERSTLYEKHADITIDCDGNDYKRYQSEVMRAICKRIAIYEASKRRQEKQ